MRRDWPHSGIVQAKRSVVVVVAMPVLKASIRGPDRVHASVHVIGISRTDLVDELHLHVSASSLKNTKQSKYQYGSRVVD